MLLDSQAMFSDAQEITSGTIYSTNTVKFGKGDVSFVPVIIQVVKSFENLSKLSVSVQTANDAEFLEPVTLMESQMLLADLKEGAKFPIAFLPKGNLGYMRLAYTVDGTESAGKITAGVVAKDGVSFHEL